MGYDEEDFEGIFFNYEKRKMILSDAISFFCIYMNEILRSYLFDTLVR